MSWRCVALDAPELPAALLLGRHESVSLEVPRAQAGPLQEAGFVEAPRRIESFLKAPVAPERLTHRHRRVVRSLKRWRAAGLRIELSTIARFGLDRFLEELWRPIWLPAMYGLGMTPYGAHQLEGVQALATDAAPLAIVTAGGEIAGGALLRPGTPLSALDQVQGERPSGLWLEGLIYFLAPRWAECRRAFLVELAAVVAAAGHQWLSLGQDAPWCEAGYEGPLSEKLHLADTWVARQGPLASHYSVHPRAGEGVVLLRWDSGRGGLSPEAYGEPLPRAADLRAALAGRSREREERAE